MGRPSVVWTDSTVSAGSTGPDGSDGVGILVARVHVGPDGPVAEGVLEHPVRAANPAAAEGVPVVVDDAPAGPGRVEVRDGPGDALGDPPRQDRGIGGIGGTSQGPHRRRGRMRVRRRDQHPIGGDAGPFPRPAPWRGRAARGASCSYRPPRSPAGSAVVEDQAPGEERVVDLRRAGLEEAPVDEDREACRRDVDRAAPARSAMLGGMPAAGPRRSAAGQTSLACQDQERRGEKPRGRDCEPSW